VYNSAEDVKPVLHLVVDQVDGPSSTARRSMIGGDATLSVPGIGSGAVAQLTPGKSVEEVFHVHVSDDIPEGLVSDAVKHVHSTYPWLISTTASESDAYLGVVKRGSAIAFEVLDGRIRKHGLERLNFTIPFESQHLAEVLRAAAHFWYYLWRTKGHHLDDKVQMHIHELAPSDRYDEDFNIITYPRTRDVIPVVTNDTSSEPWTVTADNGATLYGVELENTSNVGFFVSMLYFDCSNLEIRKSGLDIRLAVAHHFILQG